MKLKNSKDIKSNGIMLVERADHLPYSIDELYKRVGKLPHVKRYAMILHDRDLELQTGEPIAKHYHIMMEFSTRVRLASVANQLNIKQEQLNTMTRRGSKNGVANGFAYLLHITDNAEKKHQYSADEVRANFDFPKYIEKLQSQIPGDTITQILDDFADGLISKLESLTRLRNLGGRQLANNRRKIDEIELAKQALKAEQLLKIRQQRGNSIKVIYCFGSAGVGKTRYARLLAKTLAKKHGLDANDWVMTGSSNDPFERLKPATVLICDDMRGGSRLHYEDLLRLLDPHNTKGFLTNSRFHNVMVVSSYIIITSPLNPGDFYRSFFKDNYAAEAYDKIDQLGRRLSTILFFDNDYVYSLQGSFRELKGRFFVHTDADLKFENYLSDSDFDDTNTSSDEILKIAGLQ